MPRLTKPKAPRRIEKIVSLDTETTGLDFYHGARPFLVTVCDHEGVNTWWQFPVDPMTRKVDAIVGDLNDIQSIIMEADRLVGQNIKFDVKGLSFLYRDYGLELEWPWGKTVDTLIAGHLLASDQPHDLTSMALVYCQEDIQPLEDALKLAVGDARRLARKRSWRIAEPGLREMPSVKSGTNADYWLPRAAIVESLKTLDFNSLPVDPRQPRVGRVNQCSIRIDRGSKWGNPFVVGKDGDRSAVVRKYVDYILRSDLVMDLPELYGQTLGCHCSPGLCHGDVLKALCHPWFTVCQDYANGDSSATLGVWRAQERLIEEQGLRKIFDFRMNIPPVVLRMEFAGVTADLERTKELKSQYEKSAAILDQKCSGLSGGLLKSMPRGVSNALRSVLFDHFSLPVVKKTKNKSPSVDKFALEMWLDQTDEESTAHEFISGLLALRKRQTALNYIESYEKYWIPGPFPGTMVMFPTVNPTASRTLRMGSENPNEQQISNQAISESGNDRGRSVRYMFGPSPDREWWTLDYQNLELRIPAYAADERDVVWIFEHPDEPPYFGSYHLAICDLLYPKEFAKQGKKFKDEYESTKYKYVKCGNFAVLYGAQDETADRTYHYPGACKMIKKRFAKMAKLSEKQIALANKQGYVETLPDREVDPSRGYPLFCPRITWGGVMPTVPLNFLVQGTAMWIATTAMVECDRELTDHNSRQPSGSESNLIMQIHDEMAFDMPRRGNPVSSGVNGQARTNLRLVAGLKQLMERSGDRVGIPTPVSVKYHATTWADGVSVTI